MKRPLLPAEKKALAYERDHINIWEEDPHQFRRDWPRTKARSNRAYRWGVRASLDTLALSSDTQDDPGLNVRPRRLWGKRKVEPLRAALDIRLTRRVQRSLAQFFATPYQGGQDQEHFLAWLTVQTVSRNRSPYTQELARNLDELLTPDRPLGQRLRLEYSIARRPWSAWLAAFLADAPEWEPRLRNWITGILSEG